MDCDISFLLSFISFLLSGDPLTHERRAMTELDALALTAAQKANHPDVHQGHFVQVQHDAVSIALDLRPEALEMFRLDPAAEPEDRVPPVRDLLAPERHGWYSAGFDSAVRAMPVSADSLAAVDGDDLAGHE